MRDDYGADEFVGIAPPPDESRDISQQDLEGMPLVGGFLFDGVRVQQAQWVGVEQKVARLRRRLGETDVETAGVKAEAKVQCLQCAFLAAPEQSDGEVSQVGRGVGYERLFICSKVIGKEGGMAGLDELEITTDASLEWGHGTNSLSGAVAQGNGEMGRFVSEKSFGCAGAVGPYLDLRERRDIAGKAERRGDGTFGGPTAETPLLATLGEAQAAEVRPFFLAQPFVGCGNVKG